MSNSKRKSILKRTAELGLLTGLPALSYFLYHNYPKLNILNGFSAKNVCSCTFGASRNLASVEAGENSFMPVKYAGNQIDFEEKSVTSSIFGLKKRKAVFQKGIGCILLQEKSLELIPEIPSPRRKIRPSDNYPFDDVEPEKPLGSNFGLKEAVKNAFDPDGKEIKKTRAVIVLHKGKLVEEKYGQGFSADTKFSGWSMTKSIVNAILGILEKQGEISIYQDKLFEEWKNDQRAGITLNDLLQMSSGLEWNEDYTTISDVNKMLFLDKDMSLAQLKKPITGAPGKSWNYSSGTTNLLSVFIRKQFSTHQEYLDFWYSQLIDKIGMHSMMIETDLAGNYVGSSYSLATARDWSKFGLLYLNKGHWKGEQILTEGWTKYSATAAKGSNGEYGAHFWLNASGKYPNVPRDLMACCGFQGQYEFIVPSKDLVVVRFGLSEHPVFDVDHFLHSIITCFP